MAVTTTTAPELTAEQVQHILVQPLQEASKFLALGPRIFNTNGNPVRIPKLSATDDATIEWYGEGETIDDVDVDFGEVNLLPSTMKSVKVLTRFSNELARQSVVALDAALKARLVSDVARKIDAALFAGDGGSPAGTLPKGLLNFTDTTPVAVGGAITLDKILDAEGAALDADVDPSGLKWVMRPSTLTALRKLKDNANRYQLQPDPSKAGGYTLLGYPITTTKHIPVVAGPPNTTKAVLADFSQIAVAQDQTPTVKVLDQTFGDSDEQAIRVTTRYDVAPLNAAAVVILTGITA